MIEKEGKEKDFLLEAYGQWRKLTLAVQAKTQDAG